MIKKIIFGATLLALSITAAADNRVVTRAYEVKPENFRLPVTESSTLGMRACSSCEAKALRVTTSTRYSVNDESVDLQEFRRLVRQASTAKRAAIIVKHHLESDTVTAVALSL